jgi:hypothetical protein
MSGVRNRPEPLQERDSGSAPERIRTSDLRFRSPSNRGQDRLKQAESYQLVWLERDRFGKLGTRLGTRLPEARITVSGVPA